MPSAVTNPVLDKHIELTVEEMLAQLDHASRHNTRAKTGYYKVAIILATSILEALLHHYIVIAGAKDSSLFSKKKINKHDHIQDLGSFNSIIGNGRIFCIHEVNEYDYELTPKTNLNSMVNFCYSTELIGTRIKNGIEYAQEKRNKVHLQGLASTSYQFNALMLDRILGTILAVYSKIENV